MKFLVLNLAPSLLIFIFTFAFAMGEPCEQKTTKAAHENLLDVMDKVNDSMYIQVMKLKVNYDGEGSLSVYFDEDGTPQLMRLNYKTKNSKVTQKVLAFNELAKGNVLEFENIEFPGKAIIVGKADPFKNGSEYQFKVSLRSKTGPDQYESHILKFSGTAKRPQIKNNNKKFSMMVLSPGIRRFAWDGTFKKVEFK